MHDSSLEVVDAGVISKVGHGEMTGRNDNMVEHLMSDIRGCQRFAVLRFEAILVRFFGFPKILMRFFRFLTFLRFAGFVHFFCGFSVFAEFSYGFY